MTTAEAVAAINAIDTTDPEAAHGALDDILLELVADDVRVAAVALVKRCRWWACA